MTTQEFQKIFAWKTAYNTDDLMEGREAKAVKKMTSFWNSMKKAGATSKALNDEFSALKALWEKEGHFHEIKGMIDIIENVIENHGCVLARDKRTHNETVLEREVPSPELTDMLWEDREYNNLVC